MRATELRATPTELFLRMQPSWSFIDELREFVESFCAAACPGAEREEQLALAAHELMQNAVASASDADVELKLALDPDNRRVFVSVTNVCTPAQLARLRARLERLYAHADPLQGYVASMAEAPHERGGLGLARIRFEAELELELDVHGDRVTVHASGPLAGRGTAPARA